MLIRLGGFAMSVKAYKSYRNPRFSMLVNREVKKKREKKRRNKKKENTAATEYKKERTKTIISLVLRQLRT